MSLRGHWGSRQTGRPLRRGTCLPVVGVALGQRVHEEQDEANVGLALGAVGRAKRCIARAVHRLARKLRCLERERGDETGHQLSAGHSPRLLLLEQLHVAPMIVAHLAHDDEFVGVDTIEAGFGVGDEVLGHVKHALVAAGRIEGLEGAGELRLGLEVLLRHTGGALGMLSADIARYRVLSHEWLAVLKMREWRLHGRCAAVTAGAARSIQRTFGLDF